MDSTSAIENEKIKIKIELHPFHIYIDPTNAIVQK